jgi:hypothetical protein
MNTNSQLNIIFFTVDCCWNYIEYSYSCSTESTIILRQSILWTTWCLLQVVRSHISRVYLVVAFQTKTETSANCCHFAQFNLLRIWENCQHSVLNYLIWFYIGYVFGTSSLLVGCCTDVWKTFSEVNNVFFLTYSYKMYFFNIVLNKLWCSYPFRHFLLLFAKIDCIFVAQGDLLRYLWDDGCESYAKHHSDKRPICFYTI